MIHLLLIDDNDINNFLLKHLINKCDHQVVTHVCVDAHAALDYIKDCIRGEKPIDMILLDINMPLMTGWDLLDELKQDGFILENSIPVHMLSSSVHKNDIEKSKQYPEVSSFISKPISLNVLNENLQNLGIFKKAVS